jgi:hypothetical protein
MGLLEKRALLAFQENEFKTLTTEINNLAGYPVDIEVHWESLAEEDYSHLYTEGFTKVYFTPIIEAFKEITVDDLGKQGLADTLKKIVIKNENDTSSASYAYTYNDGVLTIDHKPFTNIDYYDDRSKELATLLMKQM